MPPKETTMILTVDLDCTRCYKKIRKTLCKLQDKENIKAIAYDEKKKTVTISGPFCPQKLFKILCCEACDCIVDIETLKKPVKPSDQPVKDPAPAAKPPETPPATTPATKPPDKPPAPPPVVIVPICLAGHACRCNCDSPCSSCQGAGDGGHRPCSCGCGGEYRPCRCGCGQGYEPCKPDYKLGHYSSCQVTIFEEGQTTCAVM